MLSGMKAIGCMKGLYGFAPVAINREVLLVCHIDKSVFFHVPNPVPEFKHMDVGSGQKLLNNT